MTAFPSTLSSTYTYRNSSVVNFYVDEKDAPLSDYQEWAMVLALCVSPSLASLRYSLIIP